MKRHLITFLLLLLSFMAKCGDVYDGKIKINIILKAQSDAAELSRMADNLSTKATIQRCHHTCRDVSGNVSNFINEHSRPID